VLRDLLSCRSKELILVLDPFLPRSLFHFLFPTIAALALNPFFAIPLPLRRPEWIYPSLGYFSIPDPPCFVLRLLQSDSLPCNCCLKLFFLSRSPPSTIPPLRFAFPRPMLGTGITLSFFYPPPFRLLIVDCWRVVILLIPLSSFIPSRHRFKDFPTSPLTPGGHFPRH